MREVTESPRFSFNVAKPGVKVSGAIEPGISLTPTLNKFEINGLASKEMGLVTGDSVLIVSDDNSDDLNAKFYIGKVAAGNGAKVASHENEEGLGKALSFTYAGIYSKIFLAAVTKNADANEVPKDRLRQLGFAVGGTALKKVYAKLESIGAQEINGEEVELFKLYDFMITDHTPKVMTKGEKA